MELGEIRGSVENRIPGYMASGVATSLKRNDHMNVYAGEAFDEGLVPDMLRKLVKVSHFSSTKSGDVLMALKRGADRIRKHTDAPLKQATIDAILVDFINYVGMTCCVDFALYTRDLGEP